jgi:hypothetical protein
MRERLALGRVIDAVRIDPAEVSVEHLLGGRLVAAEQRLGHGFVRLHDVAGRRSLRRSAAICATPAMSTSAINLFIGVLLVMKGFNFLRFHRNESRFL